MITFENLTKTYQAKTVLGGPNQGVSGEIEAGGITSIIGANGAGKSTLLTIIGRLLAPTTGSVKVGGLDVARTPSATLAKKLAILRQDNHTTARLRVRELVAMGRFPHSRGRLTRGDRAAVDIADACDHTVGGKDFALHAEVFAGVLDVHAGFLEGAGLEQLEQTLAGRKQTLALRSLILASPPLARTVFRRRSRVSSILAEIGMEEELTVESGGTAQCLASAAGVQNSVSTPKVDFGWRKATCLP